MTWIDKLKNRWGVKNSWQVVIILLVFACTGFTVMYTKRWMVQWLSIESTWAVWAFNILIILPLYQVILLCYGWLFGQFQFFLNFEKKMFRRLMNVFSRKHS
ncbi:MULTISPECIES: DUF6787 family protein [Runella]|uniref:DUF6787 family protein n=1 Tax=Runella TaxID=105 RepID=UPI00286DE6E9|nr:MULTISPECIES: DUF6787 family protein [Runella]